MRQRAKVEGERAEVVEGVGKVTKNRRDRTGEEARGVG